MKKLFKNIFYLGVVRILRLIIPLLLVPILARELDKEYLSIYFSINLIAAWLVLILDFGFDYSAVKKISGCKPTSYKAVSYFHGVYLVKILISLILFIIALILSFIFKDYSYIIILSSLLAISQAMLPLWLYMSIDELVIIAKSTLIINLLFLLFSFFIKNNNDIYCFIMAMIVVRFSVALLLSKRWIKILIKTSIKTKKSETIRFLKFGLPLSKFQIITSVYTAFPGFYLSMHGIKSDIVSFGVADRIVKAGGAAISPIVQAVYPYLCKVTSDLEYNTSVKKIINYIQVIFTIFIVIALNIFSSDLIFLLTHEYNSSSESLLRLLSFNLLLISLSNIYGVQGLLIKGKEKIFNNILIFAAITHIPILYAFYQIYGVNGVVYSILLTETLVTILMFIFYKLK